MTAGVCTCFFNTPKPGAPPLLSGHVPTRLSISDQGIHRAMSALIILSENVDFFPSICYNKIAERTVRDIMRTKVV